MARKKIPDKISDISFEDALSQLESLIKIMEEEQLPLEELVDSYEQGMKLLEHCRKTLNQAKEKLLTIQPAPMAEAPAAERENPETDDIDDDIQLF